MQSLHWLSRFVYFLMLSFLSFNSECKYLNIVIKVHNFLKHLKKNLQKINTNPFVYFAFQYTVYNIQFRDNTITENLSETAKV